MKQRSFTAYDPTGRLVGWGLPVPFKDRGYDARRVVGGKVEGGTFATAAAVNAYLSAPGYQVVTAKFGDLEKTCDLCDRPAAYECVGCNVVLCAKHLDGSELTCRECLGDLCPDCNRIPVGAPLCQSCAEEIEAHAAQPQPKGTP